MYKSQQLNLFKFPQLGLLIALLAWSGLPVFSRDGYGWSKNIPVEIPTSERIQAQTALATDAQQRVWLVFLDAQYYETANHTWIAWPRRVRLFTSVDKGASFKPQPDFNPMGDSAKLITTAKGEVFCGFIRNINNPGKFPHCINDLLSGACPLRTKIFGTFCPLGP